MWTRIESFEGFRIEVVAVLLANGDTALHWRVRPDSELATRQLAPAQSFSQAVDELVGLTERQSANICFESARRFIRGVIRAAKMRGVFAP